MKRRFVVNDVYKNDDDVEEEEELLCSTVRIKRTGLPSKIKIKQSLLTSKINLYLFRTVCQQFPT